MSCVDMINTKCGRLTVIAREKSDSRGEARWLCRCDCGNETIVLGSHLRSGRVVSCGCYSSELKRDRIKNIKTKGNLKHGGVGTRLYGIWVNMKTRCLNPNNRAFRWYGAAGVTICQEWLRFENFEKWANESGYKDNLTIERINPFGSYCPENCTWIPKSEQWKNQRRSKQWQPTP